MAKFSFKPNEVVEDTWHPLPEDTYLLKVISSEQKESKAGNATYLWVGFQVTGGVYNGNKIRDSFCVEHDDEDARALIIGQGRLKRLCLAVGIDEMEDDQELIGKTAIGHVEIETYKGSNGKDRQTNKVKKYEEFDESQYFAQDDDEPDGEFEEEPVKKKKKKKKDKSSKGATSDKKVKKKLKFSKRS